MAPTKSTKAPAFQFYPNEFIGDEEQALMSLAEAGAYIRLLCRCWTNGSLPDSVPALALLCGATPQQMKKFWPAISKCFKQRTDGRWIHSRLERERKKQAEFRQRQTDKAVKRWDKPGNAVASAGHYHVPSPGNALHLQSSSLSSIETTSKERTEAAATSPAVLEFPTVGSGGPRWILTQSQESEWRELYPGLSIIEESRKALAWISADTARRKTAKGMPRFLVGWFNRANDRGGRAPAPRPSGGYISPPAPDFDCPHVDPCGNPAACAHLVKLGHEQFPVKLRLAQ